MLFKFFNYSPVMFPRYLSSWYQVFDNYLIPANYNFRMTLLLYSVDLLIDKVIYINSLTVIYV